MNKMPVKPVKGVTCTSFRVSGFTY